MKTKPSITNGGWLPWATCSVLLALTMLLEAWAHVALFGGDSFADALLAPSAHELWMRMVITAFVAVLAGTWHYSARAREADAARMREYQERLRELTAQLAYGQNDAYRSLSNRLHEGVAQSLAAGQLFLSASLAGDDPLAPDVTRSVSRILDRAIADCRDIAQELSPPALDTYGLMPALEALADQVMVRSGISVEVETASSPDLAEPVLLASYHTVAEIVAGAAANPATKTIRISSAQSAHSVDIAVRWDAEDAEDLLRAQDTYRVLGGEIRREIGDGATTVTVTAPLSSAA